MAYNIIHRADGKNVVFRNSDGSIKIYKSVTPAPTPTPTPTPTVSGYSPFAFVGYYPDAGGNSFTVPAGASTMKAWAIGAGSGGYYAPEECGAYSDGYNGGEAVKTYSVTGGNTVTYTVGQGGAAGSSYGTNGSGGATTVTYDGQTFYATGGAGDGGAGYGGDYNTTFYPDNFQGIIDVLENYTGWGFTGNVTAGSNIITNIQLLLAGGTYNDLLGAKSALAYTRLTDPTANSYIIYGAMTYSFYFPYGAAITEYNSDTPTQVTLTTASAYTGEHVNFSTYKLNAGFKGMATYNSSTSGSNGAVILYFT